jgi:hypothetical protein
MRDPREAVRRLVELMESDDDHVALMAADKVLQWAWGRPPDHDPWEHKPARKIDTSVPTTAEKRRMLDFLLRGLIRQDNQATGSESASPIEGQAEG